MTENKVSSKKLIPHCQNHFLTKLIIQYPLKNKTDNNQSHLKYFIT